MLFKQGLCTANQSCHTFMSPEEYLFSTGYYVYLEHGACVYQSRYNELKVKFMVGPLFFLLPRVMEVYISRKIRTESSANVCIHINIAKHITNLLLGKKEELEPNSWILYEAKNKYITQRLYLVLTI